MCNFVTVKQLSMVINKNIRSGAAEVDLYIEELEEALQHKENSSIYKFIIAANRVAETFATDLALAAEGDLGEGKILHFNKDDKTLERIMMLLKSVDTFEKISDLNNKLSPEVIDKLETELQITKEKPKMEIKNGGNVFEIIQEKLTKKQGGN